MANSPGKERLPGAVIKAKAPTKTEKFTIRILIVFGLIFLAMFLYWFFGTDRIGYAPLYWPLTIALLFKFLKKLHEWYYYWSISVPVLPENKNHWTVDVFTTYCPGEPREMIVNTLKAMQRITYPHTSYLCDEGNDTELKKTCEELGVVHVTRTEKTDAKAGNINNALKQATGEICVILDPDHEPIPEFLDRVLPYFEDPQLGYVQVVQAYGNRKESFVALGAAEQTYHFYGPMMMAMNSYGTTQAIGANCTFRRKALDSIGGHAPGLAEDMHTSMQLKAKGWKSIYVPEILSRGLVPSTLSGYYKQQLKWSRGVFELFFFTLPGLFKKFTWRQKLHYLTVPLYFFFGFITFIDLIVPVLALILAEVPWLVEVSEFTLMFIPLFAMNLLIRQYSQRWLLETHERGFHMIGGLLRIGTWWVFIIGFIYTLLRIKVPYIPTPKDDEPENCWKLCLPNILICLVSVGAVIYGLSIDWSPYSFFMASLAILNTLIIGFVILMSQQKLIISLHAKIKNTTLLYSYMWLYRIFLWKTRHGIYYLIRNGSVYFALGGVFLFLMSYTETEERFRLQSLEPKEMKNTGGFYTGVYIPSLDRDYRIQPVRNLEKSMKVSFDIISFYQAWGPESIEKFPMDLLQEISDKGGIPMITWEPWTSTFPEFQNHPDLSIDKKICISISNGMFDDYLRQYALKIKEYGEPVFIRFAHEPGNPAYPWSPVGGNTPNEYIGAWQHVVSFFEEAGVSNVTWVWNPWHSGVIYQYFPGGQYVDWIGLTTLNYGLAAHDSTWRSFKQLYEPYRKTLELLKRPIMLAEFGTTSYGGTQAAWMDSALTNIKTVYPEIKSLVFFNSHKDKNWITPWRPSREEKYIDWIFSDHEITRNLVTEYLESKPFDKKPLRKNKADQDFLKSKATSYHSRFVKGIPGSYELTVHGKPFYVKGVAYNTAHDWRDGTIPLTKKQLKEDFKKIKAMGANVIRRYSPGIYDRNILNTAEEYDLKVLVGFWFDPKVDYYKDSLKVKEYIKEVEETIEKYKDHPAVFAWGIGNETWGLLKHEYAKPYLIKVRRAYVKMIEHLAQRIHEIDPSRPVLTAMEHEEFQLPGEIAAFNQDAPSLDIIAINSYYIQQISKLQEITSRFDSTRPYLVSEFGPKGYWDPNYTRYKDDSIIIEDSEFEKAILYTSQWEKYIIKNKGYNIGGVAYSWRDRLEGTATWFGMTDYKGRVKPTYHAMKKIWTGKSSELSLHNLYIIGSTEEMIAGQEYEFKAVTDNNLKKELTYEWHLRREEYLEFVGDIEETGGGQKVRVTIPEERTKYRLYLYVSGEDGNVVTASRPIVVK